LAAYGSGVVARRRLCWRCFTICEVVVWCLPFGGCVLKGLNGDCDSFLGWILVREVCCGEWVWFMSVQGYICMVLECFWSCRSSCRMSRCRFSFSFPESRFQKHYEMSFLELNMSVWHMYY